MNVILTVSYLIYCRKCWLRVSEYLWLFHDCSKKNFSSFTVPPPPPPHHKKNWLKCLFDLPHFTQSIHPLTLQKVVKYYLKYFLSHTCHFQDHARHGVHAILCKTGAAGALCGTRRSPSEAHNTPVALQFCTAWCLVIKGGIILLNRCSLNFHYYKIIGMIIRSQVWSPGWIQCDVRQWEPNVHRISLWLYKLSVVTDAANSTEQRLSWESKSHWANQEIPRSIWKTNVSLSFYSSPPFAHTLRHGNHPMASKPTYWTLLNTIHHSKPTCSKWPLSSGFPHQNPVCISVFAQT